jgi:hypothetical protein
VNHFGVIYKPQAERHIKINTRRNKKQNQTIAKEHASPAGVRKNLEPGIRLRLEILQVTYLVLLVTAPILANLFQY